MSTRMKAKIAVDFAMTGLLFFLPGYHFLGNSLHEWLGALMLLLVLAHQALNLGWYQHTHWNSGQWDDAFP